MGTSQSTFQEKPPIGLAGREASGLAHLTVSIRAGGTVLPGQAVRRSGNANTAVQGVTINSSSPYNVTGILGVAMTKDNDTSEGWKEGDMMRVMYSGDVWVVVSGVAGASTTPRIGDAVQIFGADGTFRRGGTAASTLGITSSAFNAVFQSVSYTGGDSKTIAKVRLYNVQLG